MNPLLLPPKLVRRAVDDIAAIGDAARLLPALLARLDAVLAGLDRLDGRVQGLREEMRPIQHLAEVRKGIEPLDEDMHDVRTSVDELEPLVVRLDGRLGEMDAKLDDMRGDLAPVGELADKVPGVSRG